MSNLKLPEQSKVGNIFVSPNDFLLEISARGVASDERRVDVIFKGVKRFLTQTNPLVNFQDPPAITEACLADHGTRHNSTRKDVKVFRK